MQWRHRRLDVVGCQQAFHRNVPWPKKHKGTDDVVFSQKPKRWTIIVGQNDGRCPPRTGKHLCGRLQGRTFLAENRLHQQLANFGPPTWRNGSQRRRAHRSAEHEVQRRHDSDSLKSSWTHHHEAVQISGCHDCGRLYESRIACDDSMSNFGRKPAQPLNETDVAADGVQKCHHRIAWRDNAIDMPLVHNQGAALLRHQQYLQHILHRVCRLAREHVLSGRHNFLDGHSCGHLHRISCRT
mmetsp:Transcript_79880/g.222453  ORF Transcript_79880/g.222453 Transcript_79880/m.222453 type:complete len:240 (+) Transcript_79880:658-1377(+)